MVVKVGSAGQAIESVIQYPQGGSKPEGSAESSRQNKSMEKAAALNRPAEKAAKANEIAAETASHTGAGQNAAAAQGVVAVKANGEAVLENSARAEMSEEAVRSSVEEANKRIAPKGASIEFSFHEKTGRYSFKVIEQETGKVLREVPPEKSLDMVAKMFEMVGLIVDEKL